MSRVLSGIQPSGHLHLGNYFGMMSRMVNYQRQHDLFCFIVNYHALTTSRDRDRLQANTVDAAVDFLALGLDPDKATFWIQSDIPQVAELTWILSCVTSIGLMERSTSYKDKLSKGLKANMGLFSYPILMAADILLFGGEVVPVGQDQRQHLEITRDIAISFNQTFGEVFIVPQADIDTTTQLIPGIDGQKMSKSYRNTIPIFSSEEEIRELVMSIVTDSTPVDQPKDTNTPLFKIYSLFLDAEGVATLRDRYRRPGLRYSEVKKELFSVLMDFFAPFRQKREELLRRKADVIDILRGGARKASQVAETYLTRVKEITGLEYRL